MGVLQSIDYESFPPQGVYLHRRVLVSFKYDYSHMLWGTVIRDDTELPLERIIQLDDGRVVRANECQHSEPQDPEPRIEDWQI